MGKFQVDSSLHFSSQQALQSFQSIEALELNKVLLIVYYLL